MTDVFDKIKVVLGSALTSSPAAYIGSYHQAVAIKQQVFPALADFTAAHALPKWLETVYSGDDVLFGPDAIQVHTKSFWVPTYSVQVTTDVVLSLLQGPLIAPTIDKVVALSHGLMSVDTIVGDAISAGLGATTALLFQYPFDLIKTKVIFGTLPALSLGGIYRGFLPTLVGMAVYKGVSSTLAPLLIPAVGAKASAVLVPLVAGAFAYPLDTLRIRMVLDPHEKDAESTVDAIIENEGVAALWHGFPAKVVSTCCYSVAAELIARKV